MVGQKKWLSPNDSIPGTQMDVSWDWNSSPTPLERWLVGGNMPTPSEGSMSPELQNKGVHIPLIWNKGWIPALTPVSTVFLVGSSLTGFWSRGVYTEKDASWWSNRCCQLWNTSTDSIFHRDLKVPRQAPGNMEEFFGSCMDRGQSKLCK